MLGDLDKMQEMKKRYATVSPTFCLAKWMHVTLHLMSGHTHSCYLPPTHKVPVDEVKKNPRALHNSCHKKLRRKEMLEGERPSECSICWSVEDLPGEQVSDRHYRSVEEWTMPYFDKVRSLPWDADINPSYLEVSFSSVCNFKCSYCAPNVSSRWMDEVKREGPYQLSQMRYHDLAWLEQNNLMPEDPDNNPYVDAFWKWWPELSDSLMHFRITGGEPLLSPDTFRVLDWLNDNPRPNLSLSVNSNMGVPQKIIERFIEAASKLVRGKKVKDFALHTSLDTYGVQAEYLRNGLVFADFDRNVRRFMTEMPQSSVFLMCAFNNLSIVGFESFLDWVIDLRQKFNNSHRQVFLDIPHLMGPQHQAVLILTDDYQLKMEKLIESMAARQDQAVGIREREIEKMKRILAWMRSNPSAEIKEQGQRDFYLFFREHDRRRGTSFIETFPEMREFWNHCERLVLRDAPVLNAPQT